MPSSALVSLSFVQEDKSNAKPTTTALPKKFIPDYIIPLQRPRHQMTRARGQRSRAAINREFPYQVIVPADNVSGRELDRVIAFHNKLLLPVKARSAFQNDQWYAIYCFAEKEHALAFRLAFGGKLIDRPLPHS